MWNHVTFSNLKRWAKVCGKAAGDEAEDEADDMEAPLIGKRLGGPWVGFNADFFTDNFSRVFVSNCMYCTQEDDK